MASDITPLSVFSTQALKPDPGEQVTSTWGAQIAENDGHLYYAPITVPIQDNQVFYHKKQPSHNCFRIKGQGRGAAGAVSDYWRIWNSTTDLAATPTYHGTISYTAVTGSVHVHSIDISQLTNGVGYFMQYDSGTNNPLLGKTHMLVWGTGAPI